MLLIQKDKLFKTLSSVIPKKIKKLYLQLLSLIQYQNLIFIKEKLYSCVQYGLTPSFINFFQIKESRYLNEIFPYQQSFYCILYINQNFQNQRMQKKIVSNLNFRISLKKNPSQTRASSLDSQDLKNKKKIDLSSQKSSSVKNHKALTLVPRSKSKTINSSNIVHGQKQKHRFSVVQLKKSFIRDQERRLSLNNTNIIKSIIKIAANRNSPESHQTHQISNQSLQNTQINQSGQLSPKKHEINKSNDLGNNFCQNYDFLQQGNQNNRKHDLLNLKNKEVQKTQIGIQTQKGQNQRESYNEYLKFKVTKKQKYQKVQNLFNFFQNLSFIQNQNFVKYKQGFHKLNKNKKLNDQRQKRIQQLKKDYSYSYKDLCQQFQTNIIQHNKIQLQELFNQESYSNYNNFYKKYIMKIKNQLFSGIKCEKQTYNKIQNVFTTMENDFQQFNNFRTQQLENIKSQMQQLNKALQQKFKIWNNQVQQYTTIIRNCVMSISKMPQMCQTLFGFGQSKDHDTTNNQIKRFGVDIEKIPNISDFFTMKNTQNLEQIDQAFSKCCQIKCMNCVYLRSKMKYIYMKNIELEPIKKALLTLIDSKSQLNRNFQLNKHLQNNSQI